MADIKWISVKEHLPKKSGKYLVWTEYDTFDTVHFSAVKGRWNDFDDLPERPDDGYYVDKIVTHWSEGPTAPETDADAAEG